MSNWRLSGFADEAFDEFGEQLAFFTRLGLKRIDVRHFAAALAIEYQLSNQRPDSGPI